MNKHLYIMWEEFVFVHTYVQELFTKNSSVSIHIQNSEVLFLFSMASSTWFRDVGGIKEGGVRPYHGGYTVHTSRGHSA